MPSLRSRSGQASTEYVGVLALLAIVLGGAATAIAAPELPKAVVHHARVALCIVGGDICRTADARAAELEPCVTRGDSGEHSGAVSIGFLRIGGRTGWSAERRADGTVLLTNHEGGEVGATAGVGVRLGPAVDLHASGTTGARFARGRAWELPDMATLHEAMLKDPLRWQKLIGEPTYRFIEGGTFAAGSAEAGIGNGEDRAGVSVADVELRSSLGRRVGKGSTTWYYDGGADLSTLLPSLGISGRALLEYTDGSPAQLVVRATAKVGTGQTTETIGRLALTDRNDERLVQRFLFASVPAPAVAVLQARTIMRRVHEAGTMERMTYATDEQTGGLSVGAALGAQVGVETADSTVRRRLVDAVVLSDGNARRADCLGL
jgi:hypothetical protein